MLGTDNRYAVSRILELVRAESGQCRSLLDYLGYKFYELSKYSALDATSMDHVGKGALIEAYQLHEATPDRQQPPPLCHDCWMP